MRGRNSSRWLRHMISPACLSGGSIFRLWTQIWRPWRVRILKRCTFRNTRFLLIVTLKITIPGPIQNPYNVERITLFLHMIGSFCGV